ncbi:MAG: hypothetical protein WC208_15865 [Gallionella sp.]|jgi:hypothetical protein
MLKRYGETCLIAFVLLAGIIFIMPNGIEPRIQRITGFTFSMLIASGIYLLKVDIFLGALILFASLISWITVYYDPRLYYEIFALIVFLIYIVKTRYLKRQVIYDIIIFVAFLNLLFQILQIFKIYFVVIPHGQIPGLMSNINETSALYAMTAPAFFRRRRWFLLPIILAGLALSGSFQGVLAFCLVAFVWSIINLRKAKDSFKKIVAVVLWLILLAGCFVTYVKPINYQVLRQERLVIWEASLKIASVKPIMGWGFNQYQTVVPLITSWKFLSPANQNMIYAQIPNKKDFERAVQKVSKEKNYFTGNSQRHNLYIQAHNEYVEWFFTGGLVGLLIALTFLARLLYRSLKMIDKVPFYGLLSASIVCFFGFSWHLTPLALITVLYIALIERDLWLKLYI